MCAGFIASFFNPGEWYQGLQKAPLTPPSIVFPIVWNILFVLMGIAVWRVWCKRHSGVHFVIAVFIIQLGLNVLWSYLFFGMHRPDFALIEIVVLWLMILLTVFAFLKVDKLAGILMLPYLAWVSFASYLNYAFVQLNNF